MRIAALAAVVLVPAVASAAPVTASPVTAITPGHWSVTTGETVSPDRDAISFEMGWPGIAFGYLRGLSDRTDVGFKISLLYSYENTNNTIFGAGGDIPLRTVINRHEKVSLGLHFDPTLAPLLDLKRQDLTGLVGAVSDRRPFPPQQAMRDAAPLRILREQRGKRARVTPVQRLGRHAQLVDHRPSIAPVATLEPWPVRPLRFSTSQGARTTPQPASLSSGAPPKQ